MNFSRFSRKPTESINIQNWTADGVVVEIETRVE